ncbi:MAG: tetratricopeptide repeat protein [Kofleriaceae bacterium]|nr:tetratricopeptide repeat protein [Kofleriaceae bacterium]
MIDDPTLTDTTPSDTLSAQLQSFRADPGDSELFRQLKSSLKRKERPADLAELFELRASNAKSVSESTRLWFDASLLRATLGDTERQQQNFRSALTADPGHEKISNQYFDLLVADKRFAEAADVADAEISAIEAQGADSGPRSSQRLAARYRAIANLWQDHLGRLDRALQCWQRSFQLEPHNTEALERSRTIYSSLGDHQMVATLYEAELQLLGQGGKRARRAQLELALGELKQKSSDMRGAAEHLQNALELDPSSEIARERLAESLTSLQEDADHRRAGQLFVELGETRINDGDSENAISYLRRALGVDPSSKEGSSKLENVLRQARRWGDLDRLYQQQLGIATTPEERAVLLTRRVELYETNIDDRDELKEILAELAPAHSVSSEYAQRLRTLYEEDGAGEELVRMLEADLATKLPGSKEMIALLLELAATYRNQLGDRDRAAETLHQILGYEPLNTEALNRYLEHFRERRDWRGLTDLHEYTIDQLRDHGASASELVQKLETVAKLCETRLGDIDRAILTWRRIQELEGATPKTNEALRGLMSRAKMWESLVGVLEQEAEMATTAATRAEALKRIAQVYRERQVNPRRAISIYEEVLTLFPKDPMPLKSLAELYEREGDEAGLAHTLRRQLDLDAEVLDARSTEQVPGTAREWPTAKRVERLTSLRRLSGIYETELADVEGVVYSCSGILELLPGDREALERMGRVLEKSGDVERLEQTLQYHVACSAAPVERAKLLRRLARLAEERNDDVVATERWEKLLGVAPNDSECLKKLSVLYEQSQRHSDLAEVLDRALMNAEIPRAGSAAAAEMSAELKRFAKVLEHNLNDPDRAQKAWQRVLEISERDRDALISLSRIYDDAGKWRDLCDILERQIPLYAGDSPDKAAAFALRHAELLEERIGSAETATQVLEHLIAHVAPRNLEAHRRLRRLYEARGNFEPAIRVAEREMVLTQDTNAKINRGLEIGILCRDRIGDPKRALQSYERVLQLSPDHEEALSAASDLYAAVGLWRKHTSLLEKRIAHSENQTERRGLMLKVANVSAEELRDHRSAFQWYSRAHELQADETTLREMRRIAESYGLWRELANVYDADREELSEKKDPDSISRFVSLCRDTAVIASERLNDPKRAIDSLREALQVQPSSESLLVDAEKIAEQANRQVIWDILLDCISLPLQDAQGGNRVALYLKRAGLREEKSRDMEGALGDLLGAFAASPDSADIQKKLYEFAGRQKRWQEVLTIETALAQRATQPSERVAILRRKANAYENKANQPVRAFRTLISAFLILPEDTETISDLWRMARKIGNYTDSQRMPEIEAAAARIESDSARSHNAPSRHKKPTSIPGRSNPASNKDAYELSIADVELDSGNATTILDLDSPEFQFDTADSTQEIDISDVMANSENLSESAMENRTENLIEALSGRVKSMTPPHSSIPQRKTSDKGPPPPPPPRPQIKAQSAKSARAAAPKPPSPPSRKSSGTLLSYQRLLQGRTLPLGPNWQPRTAHCPLAAMPRIYAGATWQPRHGRMAPRRSAGHSTCSQLHCAHFLHLPRHTTASLSSPVHMVNGIG